MGQAGIEPHDLPAKTGCSNTELLPRKGAKWVRTTDLLGCIPGALPLSYSAKVAGDGFEPSTGLRPSAPAIRLFNQRE